MNVWTKVVDSVVEIKVNETLFRFKAANPAEADAAVGAFQELVRIMIRTVKGHLRENEVNW